MTDKQKAIIIKRLLKVKNIKNEIKNSIYLHDNSTMFFCPYYCFKLKSNYDFLVDDNTAEIGDIANKIFKEVEINNNDKQIIDLDELKMCKKNKLDFVLYVDAKKIKFNPSYLFDCLNIIGTNEIYLDEQSNRFSLQAGYVRNGIDSAIILPKR